MFVSITKANAVHTSLDHPLLCLHSLGQYCRRCARHRSRGAANEKSKLNIRSETGNRSNRFRELQRKVSSVHRVDCNEARSRLELRRLQFSCSLFPSFIRFLITNQFRELRAARIVHKLGSFIAFVFDGHFSSHGTVTRRLECGRMRRNRESFKFRDNADDWNPKRRNRLKIPQTRF